MRLASANATAAATTTALAATATAAALREDAHVLYFWWGHPPRHPAHFAFLNIGSARFAEGDDDACFRNFRGRRNSNISLFTAFTNWVDHMEHVNKKHR